MLIFESLLDIHWLWLGFILAGLSLLFTAYYFRKQSKRLSKALSDLYTLNQSVKQDALDFFNQAWPILESLGCVQLHANIGWFGEQKTVCFGIQENNAFGKKRVFHVTRDEMYFDLTLMLNRQATEPESPSFLVITTFINILEQNLVLKQAEILTSQKRLERYQLFVQHEIKNIAQFIQLLSEQVNYVQVDQDKIRLVERLCQTLPDMAQRAQKTMLHMNQPLSKGHESSELSLKLILKKVVLMYRLEASIVGDALVCVPQLLLEEVLKNILGNFKDHALTDPLIQIVIKVEASSHIVGIKISCQRDKQQQEMLAERLFEPFWTTSESGMGLGLFLARELLKQMNGQVMFEQDQEKFGFLVQLKNQAYESKDISNEY